eukprot:PhF_6_TR14967/c0_g1_i2/m.23499/K00624/E2.3.1.7; carnitine O-acetyltransferase
MYQFQNNLPRLTVPPLAQTLKKYLYHVQPLVSPAAYLKTQKIVEEFVKPNGVGEQLHTQLIARQQHPHVVNWLEEMWSDAYLMDRMCPGIHVSPSILLTPHPRPEYMELPRRCASLIHHTLDYYDQVKSETLPVEMNRDRPLCMEEYRSYFGTTRVPRRGRDFLCTALTSKHVIILFRDIVYRLNVYDDQGKRVSTRRIMHEIQGLVESPPPTKEVVFRMGGLTCLDRDSWADAHLYFNNHSKENEKAVDTIHDSLFALCIEDTLAPSSDGDDAMKSIFYGSISNRWWDKGIQITVCRNGVAGITFEHSGVDASPSLHWIRHVTSTYETENSPQHIMLSPEPSQGLLTQVPTTYDDKLIEASQKGIQLFQQYVDKLDLKVLRFQEFGGSVMKPLGVTPDAFAQMAFQATFYESFGYTGSTYESSSTKGFRRGRTETIRSVTSESVGFVDAYLHHLENNHTGSSAEVAEKLRKACAQHAVTSRACSQAQGQDRHLYGLRWLALKDPVLSQNLPEIFTDESFKTYMTILLSTSHPNLIPCSALCFGPVSDKCVGICYFLFPKHFIFVVTSWSLGSTQFAAKLE